MNSLAQTDSGIHLKPRLYIGIDNTAQTILPINQTNVFAGIMFQERLFLQYGLGNNILISGTDRPKNFHFYSGQFTAKIRVFPSRFKLSPMLSFMAGEGFSYLNSTDTAFVNETLIQNKRTANFSGIFYKMQPLYRFQIGADYTFKNFHFELSLGRHWSTIVYSPPNALTNGRLRIDGWCFTGSVSYTFRFKK